MEEELFKEMIEENYIICGSDEAGRGPLAGPVTAAAVVLGKDFPTSILNDSKKLSEKERIKISKIIMERAKAYAIVSLSHLVIDEINILNASLLAMEKALEKVMKLTRVDVFYVDGNKVPASPVITRAIVKGDQKVPEIMAASILAKVERDRIMTLCGKKWPLYGFEIHKGYGTPAHLQALMLYGASKIHRAGFLKKIRAKPLASPEQTELW